MKVYVLGAGASRAYDQSPTGQRMPLARDFFRVFSNLSISENPWVLIGDIVAHVSESRRIAHEEFGSFNDDIEEFYSEVQGILYEAIKKGDELETILTSRIVSQLVFLFASVINEVQNGPISRAHRNIARTISSNDRVLTFNWDTLMDRAMRKETQCRTDFGYLAVPRLIYKSRWVAPNPNQPGVPLLLKLHGSTNWLTSYNSLEDGKLTLMQSSDPSTLYVYESAKKPYATYAGRFMPGYKPFSYGYYPPNIPDDPGKSAPEGHVFVRARPKFPWVPEGTAPDKGLPSMPLIIPPAKAKTYDFFGLLFKAIWSAAEECLAQAEHIILIGYSFPRTDHQSNTLFTNAISRRTSQPRVSVVDPRPDRVARKFRDDFGIASNQLFVYPEPFSVDFDLRKVLR
jgi:hypothetical protein